MKQAVPLSIWNTQEVERISPCGYFNSGERKLYTPTKEGKYRYYTTSDIGRTSGKYHAVPVDIFDNMDQPEFKFRFTTTSLTYNKPNIPKQWRKKYYAT
jgi:hypothetical protein